MDTLSKWYGQKKRPHYGTILNAGRLRKGDVLEDLVRLAEDRLYPTIVRATALAHWCEGFLHGLVSASHGEAP